MQEPGMIAETTGQIPAGVPGAGIGGYQRVDHFSQLNSSTVPGLRTIFSTQPSRNVKRNKSTKLSNETCVTPVKAAFWKRGYQTRQRPGEIIFVGDPRQKMENTDMETLSLAQLNNLLREDWEKLMRCSKDQQGRVLDEFGREIVVADKFCKEWTTRLREDGEDTFADKEDRNMVVTKMHYQFAIGMARRMILEKWRLLGVYFSDAGRGSEYSSAGGQPVLNVAIGGPVRDQEVYNVWGATVPGQKVGFILKRRLIKSQSTPTNPIYGPFYLKPWFGASGEPVPPREKLRYYDDAGIVQYGTFIPAGQVAEAPFTVSPKPARRIVAGLTANDDVAFTTEIETVAIAVGPVRCFMDLYHN